MRRVWQSTIQGHKGLPAGTDQHIACNILMTTIVVVYIILYSLDMYEILHSRYSRNEAMAYDTVNDAVLIMDLGKLHPYNTGELERCHLTTTQSLSLRNTFKSIQD